MMFATGVAIILLISPGLRASLKDHTAALVTIMPIGVVCIILLLVFTWRAAQLEAIFVVHCVACDHVRLLLISHPQVQL